MLNNFCTWEWNTSNHYGPGMFSYFHIIWLVIMVLLSVLAYFYAKRFKKPKTVDRTILIIDITLFITEILKQIMYQFSYYNYFRIDVLPFSFCSVPIYVAFIGALVKNEKIKNACYTFLAFYGIVGGLSAMLYPITLNTKLIFISFQTMYWHTMLVVMAFYLIFAKGYGKSFKEEIIPPFYIFISCSLLAVVFNEVAYHAYLEPRQTLSFTVDSNPASYDYLSYGYESEGTYYLIKEEDGVFSITTNYQESMSFYIAYKEGDDTYSNYTLVLYSNSGNKYIEINDNKELVLVDTPTNYWKWHYITSRDAVFSTLIDGEDYSITFQNDGLSIIKSSDINSSTIYANFIKVSAESVGDSADFFFISNHNPTSIPVLKIIQPKVPYPIFVLIYICAFFAVSSITWSVTFGIRRLTTRKK